MNASHQRHAVLYDTCTAWAAPSKFRPAFFEEHFGDDGYELIPDDYQLRGSAVNYDSLKPCYYQVLTYDCDTNP